MEIAADLGVTPWVVRSWVRKSGVTLDRTRGMRAAYAEGRRSGEAHGRKMRSYALNEAAFEGEITPELAWLLGVTVGDGCVVRRDGKTLGLEVCGDRDVCEKAKTLLSSEHPVKHLAGECHAVRFFSIRLGESLERFGIVPDKTRTVRWPKEVPKALDSHVMRGYWDADGCIMTAKSGRKTLKTRMVLTVSSASTLMLEDVRERVAAVTGTKAAVFVDKRGYSYFSQSVFNAVKLGDWMYAGSNDTMRSDRKYERFTELRELHG